MKKQSLNLNLLRKAIEKANKKTMYPYKEYDIAPVMKIYFKMLNESQSEGTC